MNSFHDFSDLNVDDLVKSRHPVEKRGPGVCKCLKTLGPGFRRNDGKHAFWPFYETINVSFRIFLSRFVKGALAASVLLLCFLFAASIARAGLRLDSVYPTLGELGQD